jgi:hypothetical protein
MSSLLRLERSGRISPAATPGGFRGERLRSGAEHSIVIVAAMKFRATVLLWSIFEIGNPWEWTFVPLGIGWFVLISWPLGKFVHSLGKYSITNGRVNSPMPKFVDYGYPQAIQLSPICFDGE